MSKKKFPNHIAVKWESDGQSGEFLIVVGSPDKPADIDAVDGDAIASYTLNGPVKVYRQHPKLERA